MMATGELAAPRTVARETKSHAEGVEVKSALLAALSSLASLKLTVVLFAFSILLVFLGTLAQKDHDVWHVVNSTYFRVWWAQVDFVTFERLAQLFFKRLEWNLSGGFYFPGGKLIGSLLFVNLAAAHAIRFKVAAQGRRLIAGVATIAVGLVVMWLVIQSGMEDALKSELSPAFCDLLWQFLRGSLAFVAFGAAYLLFLFGQRLRSAEWWVLLAANVSLAALAVFLLVNPQARIDDSGIRILWLLIKGTGAGIILLIGCVLVFRKRAGVVLLHGGVALLMLSELLTGVAAEESQMTIPEGATVSWSNDIRSTELAVIDRSPEDVDRVTVVPASILMSEVGSEDGIRHGDLPFQIRVHHWMTNSQLRSPKAGEPNAATAGFGTRQIAEPAVAATGVGEGAKMVDFPSAYVEFASKDGDSLGTYLLSQWLPEQSVTVGDKTYDVALRFKRIHHPFSVTLKDFKFARYVGTNTPKDYSSLVRFQDPAQNIDRDVRIWMNNPLRYAGTTFYQSSFDEATERTTVLQIVKNPSWMAPYVACMLVSTGMFAHFGVILVRFLRRRADTAAMTSRQRGTNSFGDSQAQPDNERRASWDASSIATYFPLLIVLFFGGYVASKARMPETGAGGMQIYEFGKLPLAYQGRIKPYDTLARNSLQILSGRQEVGVFDEESGKVTERLPAIRWLLDAISMSPAAGDHRVFRIENLDLLDTLNLEHRPLFWRYSLNEIGKKQGELDRQIQLAESTPEHERSLFQQSVLQLASKRNFYIMMVLSFRSPPVSLEREEMAESLRESESIISQLQRAHAPHAVPPTDASTEWDILMEAELDVLRNRALGQPANPATLALNALLRAYARGDVAEFNNRLSDFRNYIGEYEQSLLSNAGGLQTTGTARSEILSQPKIDFEVFFNQFSPFYYAAVLYLIAFILGAFSWIGWTEPLRRGSMWLLWLTFLLHTFALAGRVYISGRPPVTNLYSTAIFIGWAGVLMAMMFEVIYKLGLGNIVAAVIGFLTLLVAYNLSLDGDTFIVLQAVLDTQFWLTTHVVTINLGYAATYLVGLWGIIYILFGHVIPVLNQETKQQLMRITYGSLCFAIFFSFVGTVLGGLWADDSWGRFWGWDPKENGALMIVLWNALVLHARWGGLVKARGIAVLAVGGNIITTWSYFGVNELGVGMHSYGASEKNTGMWLLAFGASQLVIIVLGMLPPHSFNRLRRSSASTV